MSQISLLHGEEDFLIDEEVKKLKKNYSEFSIERIDGARSDLDQTISALSSLPMLTGDRLVIIDSFEYEEEDEEKVFNALKNLSAGVKVVFVYHKNIDKRKKFYKLLEKIAEIKEFKGYSEWEQDKVLAWIVGRVRLYDKKISGQAANLLIEIVGLNLRMLDKEIEKISTYVGGKELIEDQDVLNLASSGETDSFALSNALRNKRLGDAMNSLKKLFSDNEQPYMVIGMLARLYRMLLQVKCLEKKGLNQFDIAQQLHAKPFFVKKCLEKTSLFSIEELSGNLHKLHHADMKIKTGTSPRLTLELLIPELCQ